MFSCIDVVYLKKFYENHRSTKKKNIRVSHVNLLGLEIPHSRGFGALKKPILFGMDFFTTSIDGVVTLNSPNFEGD